ncbi:uncharacterized protein PRCAT00001484001 [Priceomyces carsonii]|uniref:uncharacterized protein n=1 Tax=Priceomyces carsonii TaxID=28549 RepID=UPI002ED7C97C|nr:unnamed protein product [Priceomyces carsonii]
MNILVVFGATGQQGGSVISQVLQDSNLAKKFKIRAVTRDASKSKAKALQLKGIEIVTANFNDESSMIQAMKGAHTIFATTVTERLKDGKELEIEQGKKLADAAIKVAAQYLIWSSSTNVSEITKGKLRHVSPFDAKAIVEEYITGLPIKSAFYIPGSFMQNFLENMSPKPLGDGTYGIFGIGESDVQVPLIDIAADTGKFIAPILLDPEKFEGKKIAAYDRMYTLEETANIMCKMSGKTVKYVKVDEETYKSFLPPLFALAIVEMLKYVKGYGYYGSKSFSTEMVTQLASEKPVSLEEFLAKHPLKLE